MMDALGCQTELNGHSRITKQQYPTTRSERLTDECDRNGGLHMNCKCDL